MRILIIALMLTGCAADNHTHVDYSGVIGELESRVATVEAIAKPINYDALLTAIKADLQPAQPTKYRVTEQYTNVRTSPSTDADIIESLFIGEQVTVTGESGEWYSVLYGDQLGFIHQSLLEKL